MNTSDEQVAQAKAAMRAQVRELRAAITPEARAAASGAACERLLAHPALTRARVVAAYGAMPDEIDCSAATAWLRERGVEVALPRIAGHGLLTLHTVRGPRDLERGPFGLLQPHEGAPGLEPHLVDVMVVPGVAFDAAGRRLGLGGGFYDRLLARLRADCVLLGFAFDEQVVDEVPCLPHDARVHAVVTPSRLLSAPSDAAS